MSKKTSIDQLAKKAKKKKSSLSDIDKEILVKTSNNMSNDLEWFYNQIIERRDFATQDVMNEVENEISIRNDGRKKDRLYHLKDICKLINWTYPDNKTERSRLTKMSNDLYTTGNDSHSLLYNFTLRVIKADPNEKADFTDFLLSKKQRRVARKRRKLEEKNGKSTINIKISKTNDDKKDARKERARIRKEAKKLGISTTEYKEKMKNG